jgi:hypothetical protein
MSDGRKVPDPNAPPTEAPEPAAASPRAASSPGTPRAVTNPGMRVITATRTASAPRKPEGPVSKRLASEASNYLLNALSIAKELVQDFGAADRYVKAKAGIVGGWVFISLVSLIIACPGRSVQTADLGARVTVLPNADRPKASPSLTVTNTDDDPWEDVVFVVNGKYRATVEKIEAGGIFTLTPKSLLSPAGPMPSDERFRNAEMRTKHGKSELVKDGLPTTE